MKYNMYIGGYGDKSISRVVLDDGRLHLLESLPAVNASYLCFSQDRKHLYAVSETQQFRDSIGGSVSSYDVLEDGRLIQTSVQPTLGSDPCHLAAVYGMLVAANYTSGSISRFPLREDGTIAPMLPLIEHRGGGPRKDRQSGAHVHQVMPAPDGMLAVTDLGSDAVFFYPAEKFGEDAPEPIRVSTPGGFGPRHCVFPQGRDTWYVLCELESQLLVYRGRPGEAMLIGRVPVGGVNGANYPAALRLSPDRKLLAATGRGQNIISLFAIGENGLLSRLAEVPSGGDWPRDVQFTPDGRYLVCANERSNRLTAFAMKNGHPEQCDSIGVPAPACVLFT